MSIYTREWGEGDPVIALHPLALESSAFEGMAGVLAGRQACRVQAAGRANFGQTYAALAREGLAALQPNRRRIRVPIVVDAKLCQVPPIAGSPAARSSGSSRWR